MSRRPASNASRGGPPSRDDDGEVAHREVADPVHGGQRDDVALVRDARRPRRVSRSTAVGWELYDSCVDLLLLVDRRAPCRRTGRCRRPRDRARRRTPRRGSAGCRGCRAAAAARLGDEATRVIVGTGLLGTLGSLAAWPTRTIRAATTSRIRRRRTPSPARRWRRLFGAFGGAGGQTPDLGALFGPDAADVRSRTRARQLRAGQGRRPARRSPPPDPTRRRTPARRVPSTTPCAWPSRGSTASPTSPPAPPRAAAWSRAEWIEADRRHLADARRADRRARRRRHGRAPSPRRPRRWPAR